MVCGYTQMVLGLMMNSKKKIKIKKDYMKVKPSGLKRLNISRNAYDFIINESKRLKIEPFELIDKWAIEFCNMNVVENVKIIEENEKGNETDEFWN